MVLAHIKRGEESLFLLDVPVSTPIAEVVRLAVHLNNSKITIQDICAELELLCLHGAALPPPMVGLLEEQVAELKLTDDWSENNHPDGGYTVNKDPCGKRGGQQPTPYMQEVITKTVAQARGRISKELLTNNKALTEQHISDCLYMLRGAVTIVYPMGLPPYDIIRQHLDNTATVVLPQILEQPMAQLWFAGKELKQDKKLQDYIGKNEKTKVVLKLTKLGHGPPTREPQLSEAEQSSMMAYWHRRQEQMKKLEADGDDSYLNSNWADSSQLQRQFQGLDNIKWRPG